MGNYWIHCCNKNCQAPNPENRDLCEQCHTPIVRRYLWAKGDKITTYQIGDLIGDRYLLKQKQVLLDTKPALAPWVPEEIPTEISTYLKLFPYRQHIPQVYGYIASTETNPEEIIWLFEYGTVPTEKSGELKYQELLPELTTLWAEATGMRQLNWLWQIARLWNPLKKKEVVSSLLNTSQLRVNGFTIQLRELELDGKNQPSLKHLGKLWSSKFLEKSDSSITEFLTKLCQTLEKGQINQADILLAYLDGALYELGNLYERKISIYTCTDTGPTREHNEDACYPAHGTFIKNKDVEKSLTIVCDGLGGQEGGERASKLAIENLEKKVKNIPLGETLEGWIPKKNLEKFNDAVCETNEIISDINNEENRYERQRMGTTVVMAKAHAHEMYLTHVGDSRIYWITKTGCHQITIDDDLASREVKLGYVFYRDIIQYPRAGALVQALGTSSSEHLYPNIQRLVIDEDSVFLLCSDGLSDFDRVEQYWQDEIVGILEEKKDLESVTERLLAIANSQNGHDNITIALIHVKVKKKYEDKNEKIAWLTIKEYVDKTPKTILNVKESRSKQGLLSNNNFLILGIVTGLLVVVLLAIYFILKDESSENKNESTTSTIEKQLEDLMITKTENYKE